MQIRPYLIFKGECQQAIELYCRAFQTKPLQLARFSDIPQGTAPTMAIAEEKKEWILQATIAMGGNFIRMSDTLGELDDSYTDRVGIAVECSVEEVRHAFGVLAEEGNVGIPLQKTFFSPLHGLVHDMYGVMWNLIGVDETTRQQQ